jgi:hypothetical protein
MADAMREIHEIHEQIRDLALPARAPEPVPMPDPSPFNLPSLPALRVATGGPELKPPPLSPPS